MFFFKYNLHRKREKANCHELEKVHLNIFRVSGEIEIQQKAMMR